MTYMSLTLSDGEEVNLGKGDSDCEVYSSGDITGDATYRLVGASLHAGDTSLVHMEQIYRFVGIATSGSDLDTESFPSTMRSGDILNTSSGLESPDQIYKFFVQEDANLVTYDTFGEVMWASNTANDCDDPSTLQLRLQPDGDLVLWCGETALWRSQTGTPNDICRIVALRNDGQLTMYNVGNQLGIWSSSGQVPLGLGPSNLTSPHSLTLQGTPVLKRSPNTIIWTAGNGCNATDSSAHLKMQEDGNLVLYCDASNTIAPWATNTADTSLQNLNGSNVLFLTINGNMKLVNKRGQTTWTSDTAEAQTYFPST